MGCFQGFVIFIYSLEDDTLTLTLSPSGCRSSTLYLQRECCRLVPHVSPDNMTLDGQHTTLHVRTSHRENTEEKHGSDGSIQRRTLSRLRLRHQQTLHVRKSCIEGQKRRRSWHLRIFSQAAARAPIVLRSRVTENIRKYIVRFIVMEQWWNICLSGLINWLMYWFIVKVSRLYCDFECHNWRK